MRGLNGDKYLTRGKRAMNVKDVMTPHVLSVTPDELIFVAARPMLQKKSVAFLLSTVLAIWSASSAKATSCTAPILTMAFPKVKAKPSFDAASTRFLLIFLVKPNRE